MNIRKMNMQVGFVTFVMVTLAIPANAEIGYGIAPAKPSEPPAVKRLKTLPEGKAKPAGVRTLSSPVFGFFPHGSTLWEEAWVYNHCDLNPARGSFFDFNGTNFTYDSHAGHDSVIRSFDEQTIGVPIFAAMDGTVVAVHDGEFDRNTVQGPRPVNFVEIDHGDGLSTRYLHMKQWSIPVVPGQFVKAGEQIGLTGSSGNSDRPHLHFECRQDGQWFEPSSGPMRPGPSNWLNQIPIQEELSVWESSLTESIPVGWAPPYELPRKGIFLTGSRTIRNVTFLKNVPANSTWRRIVRDPAGVIRQNSGNVAFPNQLAHRHAYVAAGANPVSLDLAGNWTVEFFVNGERMVTMPFLVVATPGEVVNRAPNAIDAVIDPITYDVDLPVFCRVVGDLILDDPDYDVVRYRYLWKVDGLVVRDVTSAGRADCIPHGLLQPGGTVSCEVTPSDGLQNGPTALATVRATVDFVRRTPAVSGGTPADLRFSDDIYMELSANGSPLASRQIYVTGRSHAETVGSMEFRMEAHATSGVATQVIELYDYVARAYVEVDRRAASEEDSVATVAATGDPGRFVSGLGWMLARITFVPDGPNSGQYWTANIDQVHWLLLP